MVSLVEKAPSYHVCSDLDRPRITHAMDPIVTQCKQAWLPAFTPVGPQIYWRNYWPPNYYLVIKLMNHGSGLIYDGCHKSPTNITTSPRTIIV